MGQSGQSGWYCPGSCEETKHYRDLLDDECREITTDKSRECVFFKVGGFGLKSASAASSSTYVSDTEKYWAGCPRSRICLCAGRCYRLVRRGQSYRCPARYC